MNIDYLKKNKIAIYGAGNEYIFFKKNILNEFDIYPQLILDYDIAKKKNNLNFHCSKTFDFNLADKDLVWIITIASLTGRQEAFNQLRLNGYKKIYYLRNIYPYHLVYGGKFFYRNVKNIYLKNFFIIIKNFFLLSDHLSKIIYVKVLFSHFFRVVLTFPSKPYSQQYIDHNIFSIKDYKNIVQLGAFDGDTFNAFVKNKILFDNFYLYEPDKVNFLNLKKRLKKLKFNGNAIPINKAVGNKVGFINFASDGSPTASITQQSSDASKVQITKLDIENYDKINLFVIIDIEGFESEAIKGMTELIKQNQPNLAVAVYHYPDDIFKIQQLILSINKNYKFYLRNYSGTTIDTVLFCKKTTQTTN